jgi:hypothetical protein
VLGHGTFNDPAASVNSWADVEIGNGATLNLNSNNGTGFLLRQGAKMTVDTGGTLALNDSNGNPIVAAVSTNSYIENSGTVSWTYFNGAANTMVDVALLNHGTVTIDSVDAAFGLEFVEPSPTTDNYAVKMDGGSLTLKRKAQMTVDYGYEQTGGNFRTDNTNCALYLNGSNRVAEFDGGTLMIGDNTHTQYLYIEGSTGATTDTVNLKGVHLYMKVRGDTTNDCDELYCQNGTVNIDPSSSWLFVTNTLGGAVQAGKVWDIIFGGSITGDFASKDFNDMAPGITSSRVVQNGTLYELGS